jgi:hypothetical protein
VKITWLYYEVQLYPYARLSLFKFASIVSTCFSDVDSSDSMYVCESFWLNSYKPSEG